MSLTTVQKPVNTAQYQQPAASSSSLMTGTGTGTQSGSVQLIDSSDDVVVELHTPVSHDDGGVIVVEQVQQTSDAN